MKPIPGWYTGGAVPLTPELTRVAELPYVKWDGGAAEGLTEWLKTPNGTQKFWPQQAAVLEALHDFGGCFAPLDVGEGKSLCTFAAPHMVDAKRTLLLIPAKLVKKTEREFETLREHWKEPPGEFRIISYTKIGLARYSTYLEDYAPDLILADEAHCLRSLSAACSKRVLRYCIANEPHFVALSGSMLSNSLLDVHHILALALGAEGMPLPLPITEVRKWANCVDPESKTPAAVGGLSRLQFSGSSVKAAREAVGRRIHECAGVVRTERSGVRVSLSIETLIAPKLAPEVRVVLAQIAKDKEDPNGNPLTPSDTGRFVRTLACGFWLKWDPDPPEEWRLARKAWRQFAQGEIDSGGYDTEKQVADACKKGLKSYGFHEQWVKVRPTYKERHSAVWVSDEPLKWVASKVQDNELVWVKYRASGQRLSEILDVPYFANYGLDARGNFVEDHVGTCVLSTAANKEGRNLQYKWHKNLVLTPWASSEVYQQAIGRTHRNGQKDDVEVRLVVGHPAVQNTIDTAMDNARFVETLTGSKQKLLHCDWI